MTNILLLATYRIPKKELFEQTRSFQESLELGKHLHHGELYAQVELCCSTSPCMLFSTRSCRCCCLPNLRRSGTTSGAEAASISVSQLDHPQLAADDPPAPVPPDPADPVGVDPPSVDPPAPASETPQSRSPPQGRCPGSSQWPGRAVPRRTNKYVCT